LGLFLTEHFFFPKITGKEYLQLLTNARQVELQNVHDKNIFDLPLNQYASTYSTGMQKKLALTAILLQQNEVFILDEPFNGVDIQSNLVITEIIKKLKALKKTLILSSHIFSSLVEICDEIFLLKNGKIIKKVTQKDFSNLASELKEFTIGNRIEKLGLS
jgi:ABC-2 type transport system ATP-binding protein